MDMIDKLLLKSGLIDTTEYLIRRLPSEDREQLRSKVTRLHDTETLSDLPLAVQEINSLERLIEKNFQSLNPAGMVINGYEPAGSTIRKLYPAPFAPYAFIGDNYWAAYKARREARIEMLRDGYVLVSETGMSKSKIKKANEFLDSLNGGQGIANFRAMAADYLNVFGNCWIDRGYNKLGKLSSLEFLLPENIIPILDEWNYRVIGWQYNMGAKKILFDMNEIDHIKTYSLRSLDLGFPALAPVLVDVEADMFASIYSNTIFKKGGLIRAIVALDKIEDPSIINDGSYLTMMKKLQELFNRQFSGVRSSGQLAFTPNVTGVHNLVNPKDLEGAHDKTSDKTALKVCSCLGVPPERINIPRQSQYQNSGLVDDSVSLSFDNNVYYLANSVDHYINTILKEEGYEGIYIECAGEYSSISKTASEFGKNVAGMGSKAMLTNEFRTKILHMAEDPALDGQYLGDEDRATKELAATPPPPKPTSSKAAPTPASFDLQLKKRNYIRHKVKDIRFY